MLDLRVVGVVCAIVVGLLGPLQASEPWDRTAVVRDWAASSRNDRWMVSLSVTYFTFHLLAVLVLIGLCGWLPSSRLSLRLALLECSWLNGLSIQILSLLRIVRKAGSFQGPFCVVCATTIALHLAGWGLLARSATVRQAKLFCFLAVLSSPLFLFGFYVYIALCQSALGLRTSAFGLVAGLALLANLLIIKLDSIDNILQVQLLSTSITALGLVYLRVSWLTAKSHFDRLPRRSGSLDEDLRHRRADDHYHIEDAIEGIESKTDEDLWPVTGTSRLRCTSSTEDPSTSSSTLSATANEEADDVLTLRSSTTCQSEDTVPPVPPPSPALFSCGPKMYITVVETVVNEPKSASEWLEGAEGYVGDQFTVDVDDQQDSY